MQINIIANNILTGDNKHDRYNRKLICFESQLSNTKVLERRCKNNKKTMCRYFLLTERRMYGFIKE